MTLHFGVLLVDPRGHGAQLQDVSPVDLIADLSNEYLSLTPGALLDPIRPFGIDVKMHYIADSLEPVKLTAGVRIVPTDTYETCPTLDYLWIPGPAPSYQASAAEIAFIRARYAEVKTVFSICTGAIVLGASGIADGRRATGNRGVIGLLKQHFPKVEWSAEERWVVDEEGKLWTCGGAQTGIDMLATYIKQHFHPTVVGFAMLAGDFEIREQKYPTAWSFQ
jgi:transcriptional regulator GlxA family with amidase domain